MRVFLVSPKAGLVMLLVAALAGAFGGLVAELLASRGSGDTAETGAVELPHGIGGRYRDLGMYAPVIVGIAAGLVSLWLLSPVKDFTEGTKTRRGYAVEQLLGVAILAGASGPAFIKLGIDRTAALVAAASKDGQIRAGLAAAAPDLPAEASLVARDEPAFVKGQLAAVRAALAPRP